MNTISYKVMFLLRYVTRQHIFLLVNLNNATIPLFYYLPIALMVILGLILSGRVYYPHGFSRAEKLSFISGQHFGLK